LRSFQAASSTIDDMANIVAVPAPMDAVQAVGPVDHVSSHGTPTACGTYIDTDSVRTWPSGFTMNLRVPHWKGGLKIRLTTAHRFELVDVWNAQMLTQTEREIVFRTNQYPGGDADHDNEFGFMSSSSYEEGDITVFEGDECTSYHPCAAHAHYHQATDARSGAWELSHLLVCRAACLGRVSCVCVRAGKAHRCPAHPHHPPLLRRTGRRSGRRCRRCRHHRLRRLCHRTTQLRRRRRRRRRPGPSQSHRRRHRSRCTWERCSR